MKTLNTLMNKKIISVPLGYSVNKAEALMIEKRIRHLPVTDGTGNIVGVLSSKDFSSNADLGFLVEDLMSAPVSFVDEKDTIREAALKMLEQKISCLLVIGKDEEAVGIITTDDLLRYLVESLQNESGSKQIFTKEFVGEIANALSSVGI